MWFKLFVLLRMPVSFFCLLGIVYATGLKLWEGPLWDWRGRALGRALLLGACYFIPYTSTKLYRRQKGALMCAGLLLAAETIGAVLFVFSRDYMFTSKFGQLGAFAAACVVFALWTLPNAAVFYSMRREFIEDAEPPAPEK
jgi:hypothetical protein